MAARCRWWRTGARKSAARITGAIWTSARAGRDGGWSFPILDWAIEGDRIISHWVNRGPGRRADGSFYETHGVSLITYGGEGKFSYQMDLFDIAHQMRLCDELDEAGLLSATLKRDWVQPMKARLVAMLQA